MNHIFLCLSLLEHCPKATDRTPRIKGGARLRIHDKFFTLLQPPLVILVSFLFSLLLD